VEHELLRAAQITRSTLTFYRESPNPVATNLGELIGSVVDFQQGSIRKAGVEVQTHLVCSQPMLAFPGELRQTFTNLISNATEAMQKNGKLVVRVHPAKDLASDRDGYRILIADNGPGIPPEARKKLFEAFYTTKGEKGTGLGLWITSQLVHKHGGHIKLRSRHSADAKSGTIFSVWLPLRPEFTKSMDVGNGVELSGVSSVSA
jgi:signal transduction histidine kinase